jgi:hypothetical protein
LPYPVPKDERKQSTEKQEESSGEQNGERIRALDLTVHSSVHFSLSKGTDLCVFCATRDTHHSVTQTRKPVKILSSPSSCYRVFASLSRSLTSRLSATQPIKPLRHLFFPSAATTPKTGPWADTAKKRHPLRRGSDVTLRLLRQRRKSSQASNQVWR